MFSYYAWNNLNKMYLPAFTHSKQCANKIPKTSSISLKINYTSVQRFNMKQSSLFCSSQAERSHGGGGGDSAINIYAFYELYLHVDDWQFPRCLLYVRCCTYRRRLGIIRVSFNIYFVYVCFECTLLILMGTGYPA